MTSEVKQESNPAQTGPFLRHILATIAYRGSKVLRGAPESFSSFRAGDTSRSAAQILAHMADLLEWTLRLCEGSEPWRAAWRPVAPSEWNRDVARFFDALKRLDDFVTTSKTSAMPPEVLFQGPISDVLTHIGQLALLRRLAGAPIKGEVMILADVEVGRLGLDQAAPKREFD